ARLARATSTARSPPRLARETKTRRHGCFATTSSAPAERSWPSSSRSATNEPPPAGRMRKRVAPDRGLPPGSGWAGAVRPCPFQPSAPFGYLKGMANDRLAPRAEVVRGTLEMLALKLLSQEPMHGWGLSLKLRDISRDVFDVNQGSLYPALQAMLRRG